MEEMDPRRKITAKVRIREMWVMTGSDEERMLRTQICSQWRLKGELNLLFGSELPGGQREKGHKQLALFSEGGKRILITGEQQKFLYYRVLRKKKKKISSAKNIAIYPIYISHFSLAIYLYICPICNMFLISLWLRLSGSLIKTTYIVIKIMIFCIYVILQFPKYSYSFAHWLTPAEEYVYAVTSVLCSGN